MFGERQTRALLGPADPARSVTPPAGPSATALIQRAAAQPAPAERPVAVPAPAHRARPPRRRLLVAAVAGVVAVAAVAAYPLLQPTEPAGPAPLGGVVVPIAYQVTTDPPPAGDYLRDLAGRLVDAPYDTSSGEYTYHRFRSWGAVSQTSPEGHEMSYVEERETWAADDGSGRLRTTILGAEFPDEDSRRYWESTMGEEIRTYPQEFIEVPPRVHDGVPLPSDRRELADLLRVDEGAEVASSAIVSTYQMHVVPTQVRAEILDLLAGVDGIRWRGEVTDRAGRPGVAISYDDVEHDYQQVLVFDPQTGELLAHERVDLTAEPTVLLYQLFLDTGRTDSPGPTPTEPRLSPPPPDSTSED